MNVPLPTPKSGGPSRLSGLVMAQDTGGAIVGNHVDLFCGSGQYAEFVSGRMKNPGALNLLVSRRALNLAPEPGHGPGDGSDDDGEAAPQFGGQATEQEQGGAPGGN